MDMTTTTECEMTTTTFQSISLLLLTWKLNFFIEKFMCLCFDCYGNFLDLFFKAGNEHKTLSINTPPVARVVWCFSRPSSSLFPLLTCCCCWSSTNAVARTQTHLRESGHTDVSGFSTSTLSPSVRIFSLERTCFKTYSPPILLARHHLAVIKSTVVISSLRNIITRWWTLVFMCQKRLRS